MFRGRKGGNLWPNTADRHNPLLRLSELMQKLAHNIQQLHSGAAGAEWKAGSSSRSTKQTENRAVKKSGRNKGGSNSEQSDGQQRDRPVSFCGRRLERPERFNSHSAQLLPSTYCFYLTLCFSIDFFLYLPGWIRRQKATGARVKGKLSSRLQPFSLLLPPVLHGFT